MKAVAWHGKPDVRVETVPDPTIEKPTDAIVRITSTGLWGSDLHLYEVMGPFMTEGDILGHEPTGIIEAHAVAPASPARHRRGSLVEQCRCAGPDVGPLVEAIRPYVDAGLDRLYINQFGPNQAAFVAFFAKELGPAITSTFGQ